MLIKRLYNFLFISIFLISFEFEQFRSDSVEELLIEAEYLKYKNDEQGSLNTYLKILELDSGNYEALWNASLLCSTIGYRLDDSAKQKEYFKMAVDHAEKAVIAHPDRGHPYYVMAVAKGRMTMVVGTRQRIVLSHEIEDNILKAIDLMPDYARSWHLYGVWQSEVANVSRGERIAARFISKGLPNGSNSKAEEYLFNSIAIDSNNILSRFDLARHYLRIKQKEKAIPVLKELLELKPQTQDDPDYLEEARELLDDLT